MAENFIPEREAVFERVDRKVGYLSYLKTSMERLPVPSDTDPETDKESDKKVFDQAIDHLKEIFPEYRDQIRRLEEILPESKRLDALLYIELEQRAFHKGDENAEEEYEMSKEKEEMETIGGKKINLQDEIAELEKNPDLKFISTILSGVEGAREKRISLRQMITKLGKNYLDPDAYSDYLSQQYQVLEGKFSKVIIGRFSISLVTEDTSVWSSLGNIQYNKDTLRPTNITYGFHLHNSNLNILFQPEEEHLQFLIYMTKDKTKLADMLTKVHEHEDLHAFLTDFGVARGVASPNIHLEHLRNYKRLKEMNAPKFIIQGAENAFYSLVDSLVKYMREEIVDDILTGTGELTNVGNQEINASRSYKLVTSQVKQLLDIIRKENIPVEQAVIDKLTNFASTKYVNHLRELYKQVKENAPEKLTDFQMALVLFPSTELRHVESMVKRWTE